MDKQKMVDRIYEVMSDKELTMGCKLSYHNRGYISEYTTYYKILSSHITIETRGSCNFPEGHKFIENIKDNEVGTMIIDEESKKYQRNRLRYLLENEYNDLVYYNTNVKYEPKELINNTSHIYKDIDGYKIIGHPVMIGDVLEYTDKYFGGPNWSDYALSVCDLWLDKKKPIDDQIEKCIEYIYNLINQGKN